MKKTLQSFCLLIAAIISISNAKGQSAYFTTIVTGNASSHTLGIKNNGTLWAWGYNGNGQLGDNTNTNKNSPIQVGIATNWVSISTGSYHSLGITADGKLWAWGNNGFGQMGDGTVINKYIPTQIGNATNWVSVSAGSVQSLGITADGKLWAWGDNGHGELGIGSPDNKFSPTQVGTATNWVKVSAGNVYFSLGITSDGTLWSWGYNGEGELGNGASSDITIPTKVGTATNWVNVSAGGWHAHGITADGKLWGWGFNAYGQLGVGDKTNRNIPTQVGVGTNWVNVSAGGGHTLGITSDGKLWGLGSDGHGELGNIYGNSETSPAQIGTASNWVSISAGKMHSTAITIDGLLWGSGYNVNGELGDLSYTTAYNFKQTPTQTNIANGLAATGAASTMQQGQYNMFTDATTLIASVNSTEASLTPLVGSVTAKVWIETAQPANYVKRHYQITPASNAATVTGRVTLYFLQAEFDAFNALNNTKLPASSSDVKGIGNLYIEKRSGVSSDGTGLPKTYPTTNTPVTIKPADADIVWNALQNRWEVSFNVKGFSGFFVKTQVFTLPLGLTSFNGSKVNDANHLVWITSNEINTGTFNIEFSSDAVKWNLIGTVAATGNVSNNYNFNHHNAPAGKIFYRLKIIDRDGQFTYSNIIYLNNSELNDITIYPNPVKNIINISVPNGTLNTMATLINMEGKLLHRILITKNQQVINVQDLLAGIYLIKFADGTQQKFIKE